LIDNNNVMAGPEHQVRQGKSVLYGGIVRV